MALMLYMGPRRKWCPVHTGGLGKGKETKTASSTKRLTSDMNHTINQKCEAHKQVIGNNTLSTSRIH